MQGKISTSEAFVKQDVGHVPMDKVPLWTHVCSCLCAQHREGRRHRSVVFKCYCLSPVECLRYEEMVKVKGDNLSSWQKCLVLKSELV